MVRVSSVQQKKYDNVSVKQEQVCDEKSISVFIPKTNKNAVYTIEKQEKHVKEQEAKEAEKKETIRKIMLGVGIGMTVAAACFMVADLRRPNSFLKSLLKKGFLKTKLGREIKDGVEFAREAKNVPMEPIQNSNGTIFGKILDKVSKDGGKIYLDVTSDNAFIEHSAEFVTEKLIDNPLLVSQLEKSKRASEVIKNTIELAGTGPTKMAQILSNETEIMTQIERKMPELAEAIRSTRSKCCFSRTFEEAAKFLEEAFPGKGYVLEKELSAGSIGATYMAKKPDGARIVVKMIKSGVSAESLKAEQSFFESVIAKVANSSEQAENLKKMSKELYSGWVGELDLFQSMKNNKMLAQTASRFSVAKVSEVAKNGQCLIMDMAKGIQMNQLIEILKDYKLNPADFHTKYASLIEVHPWLANPNAIIESLSPTVLKTFDEQFLFVKKGAKTIMHADPHSGNFFVTMNKKGKLALEFIDTDNCILRNSAEIKRDLKMIANYCVGNEKKVAEYFVNMCKCNPAEKKATIDAVALDMRKYIFDKKMSITDLETFLKNIKVILKRHGLDLTGNTNSLKAQIQYLSVATEAAKLSGKSLNAFTVIRDIPKAIISMLRAGINPFSCINDAAKYAAHNVKSALGASLQFLAA